MKHAQKTDSRETTTPLTDRFTYEQFAWDQRKAVMDTYGDEQLSLWEDYEAQRITYEQFEAISYTLMRLEDAELAALDLAPISRW